MARKTNAEKVKNFPLQPVRARPYRNKGIDDWIVAPDPHSQSHLFAPWNGHQVIVQFESRLGWETVHASGVGQKMVLQLGVFATACVRGPPQLARHPNRRLPPEFNYF